MPDLAALDLGEEHQEGASDSSPTEAAARLSERVLASGQVAEPAAAPAAVSAPLTPPVPPLRAPGHTGAPPPALARRSLAGGDADAVGPVAPALALLNLNGALGGAADGGNRDRSGSDWSSGSAPTSPMLFRAQPPAGSPSVAAAVLGQAALLAENDDGSGGEEDRLMSFHTPIKSGGLVLVDAKGRVRGESLKSTFSSESESGSDSDEGTDSDEGEGAREGGNTGPQRISRGSMSPPVSDDESGDSDGYHTA